MYRVQQECIKHKYGSLSSDSSCLGVVCLVIALFITKQPGLNSHKMQNSEHQKDREVKSMDINTFIINSLKTFLMRNLQ